MLNCHALNFLIIQATRGISNGCPDRNSAFNTSAILMCVLKQTSFTVVLRDPYPEKALFYRSACIFRSSVWGKSNVSSS